MAGGGFHQNREGMGPITLSPANPCQRCLYWTAKDLEFAKGSITLPGERSSISLVPSTIQRTESSEETQDNEHRPSQRFHSL